jgi:hypothetical protein
MNILAKAQKHNLHFLDLRSDPEESYQEKDPICNGCHENLTEILSNNEFEFLLKCKKKSDGLGGCSWTTCNSCIQNWYKHLLKKKTTGLYTCPQCKVPKTFDIDFKEINEITKKMVKKNKVGQLRKTPVKNNVSHTKSDITKMIKKNKDCQLLKTHVKNTVTGRWVLKTGTIGRKILNDKDTKNNDKILNDKDTKNNDKILNKITGRMVKKTGKIGIKILAEKSKKEFKEPTNKVRIEEVNSKGLRKSSRVKKNNKKTIVDESVEKKVTKKKKNIIDDVFDI